MDGDFGLKIVFLVILLVLLVSGSFLLVQGVAGVLKQTQRSDRVVLKQMQRSDTKEEKEPSHTTSAGRAA